MSGPGSSNPIHTLNTLPAAHAAEMAGAVPVRSFSLQCSGFHDDTIILKLQLDAVTVDFTCFCGPDALLRARSTGIRYNETGDTRPDTRSRLHVARLPGPVESVFAAAVDPSGAVLPFPAGLAQYTAQGAPLTDDVAALVGEPEIQTFRFSDQPGRVEAGVETRWAQPRFRAAAALRHLWSCLLALRERMRQHDRVNA